MFNISSTIRPTVVKPCKVLILNVLARQIPWPGELGLYFGCSDFDITYVNISDLLKCKMSNHQTLHSPSPRCTDWAGILTWWPWPIFCTPVPFTHFTSTFNISSTIKPTTTKPCIVLLINVQTLQVPWPCDLDLYLTHFTLMFDNFSTIRPTTTISCIVLLLDVLTWQVPWPGDHDLYFSDFYIFYVDVPLSLRCIIRKVSAEDIAIRGNGTGLEYMCPTRHFVYIFFQPIFQLSTAKNEINLFNPCSAE